jgi:methanogenesis imperfect marker protein 11
MPTTLTPAEVRAKYGPMFCKGFFTMVDQENGLARLVETCSAKGPIEWDTVNRKRTGGVITGMGLEGLTLTMDAVIGDKKLKFGPASAELGGQGIESLTVDGDRVRTKWRGIAGAGVGVGACIPQADGVIETVYPDNFAMGGAHEACTEIVTPLMIRVVIGVDDTDTKEKGASWVTTMKMARECPVGKFLGHKIVQLNPKAPNKTTNCCATAVAFAVRPNELDALVGFCSDFVAKDTLSDDTVMTVYTGLKMPDPLVEWSWGAKSILYTLEDAERVARENGVRVINITGRKGVVGAVAAIGCFDIGLRAAGLPEDFADES